MVARKSEQSDVVVVNARLHPLRDLYFVLLRMPWWGILVSVAGSFLFLNALFALGYVESGGVTGVRSGSFRDAFFFSVQTMGTIGYGSMYPTSTSAHMLVVAESVVGLVHAALVTGIVFTRFSLTTGRLVFSAKVCISPMDGVPTLTFRIGNDRSSTIYEAVVRASLIRTERTAEGVLFYRLYDLKLARERSPALQRSFMVLHPIDEQSPLYRMTPDSCRAQEIELAVTVVGTDDTSLQPVHAQRRYVAQDIAWGARLADVLSELPDGRLQLDLSRFHDVVPTTPSKDFPFPASTAGPSST
jgi:inward rectifier potassium channel